MQELLKFVRSGRDYSNNIESKGIQWKRNDLDADTTGRTKDGKMRRDKVATKRTVSYNFCKLTRQQLAELDDDLSDATFEAVYLDIHGSETRTFYCSSFSATLDSLYDDDGAWVDASATLVEV